MLKSAKMPHLGLSRFSMVPEAIVEEFVEAVKAEPLRIDVREQDSVFAGIEWLMPTAVVLYITRAYFDAFFGELGKDHYDVLKRAARTLYRKMSAMRLVRHGTPGKLREDVLYSPAFSIVLATGEEISFKFLIQPELSDDDAARALEAFFAFIASLFEGTITPETLAELEKGRVASRTLLLAFDFESGAIVTVDPLPPHVRPD